MTNGEVTALRDAGALKHVTIDGVEIAAHSVIVTTGAEPRKLGFDVNIAGASYAQCRGARDVGFQLTFGSGVGSPEPTDIRGTDCLVLIGSHLGENMHNSQVQEFADAVGRGVPVIVVDPRFSVAASKAKYWLPVKPGTDLALLLAWMNLLVTEGRYDREFVAAHGHGFERFAEEIFRYLSIPEKEYPQASRMFEQPLMDRAYFDNLADSFRSPHLWKWHDGQWQLRHTVWHGE